ncbi:MAG: substrate-binding domain-containing protein [Clostridia bacterium]|nr:substrate-binding domain-containing protein [Clostridia bacterium]
MKNSVLATRFLLRLILTVGLSALSIWLLVRYEYLSQIHAVDNLIGTIPLALVFLGASCSITLVWIKKSKRNAALSIMLSLVMVCSYALFPNALRANWWIQQSYPGNGENVDITVYAPFTGKNTARLEEESSLTLKTALPVLDGALALYPVYAAIAEATYDKTAYEVSASALFTDTVQAFRELVLGNRDIIFMARPAASQMRLAEDANVQIQLTPIGREAFVFLVGAENPIENLSLQQIRNVYSGKTARWNTLGWKEGGSIVAFQRPEGSGSQTGIQSVMGDLPLIVPQPLPDKSLVGSNSLMQQISVHWKGVQPALGYSYRFFANTMNPNPEAKMLKINGVEPSVYNIASGAYPFSVEFYAVTNGDPQGNVKLLIDWILSPQGQRLIEKCGYVPLG